MTLRFGINVDPMVPFDTLIGRWQDCEAMGFDQLFVADHSRDYRSAGSHWLDGWTVLAAMAVHTRRIRIGTLVTNPILRPPALVGREAIAVDRLSRGRLDLGIGTGIAPFDHDAMGVDYWEPKERAARFAEYVAVVDGVSRGADFDFEGRYHRTRTEATPPGPVQQPRPPIIVGGQSPTARRVAAELADGWNTHGQFGASAEEIVASTAVQNREMDEACTRNGRDPRAVVRGVLLFAALDPWARPGRLEWLVTEFREIGITDFVLFWPEEHERAAFETAVADTIPSLRG